MRRLPSQTEPEFRQLRIYAIDPMNSRAGDYQATVQIRFEKLQLRGAEKKLDEATGADAGKDAISFIGDRVEMIDVDASGPNPVWLKPVELDNANIAMQHGLEPSESDPQFHQQMVYAVAMRTLEQFDRALGRFVYFRGRRRLRLVPHAFRGGNAFYHPGLRAVLFGFFAAREDAPGQNLPGQTIFTCLSHDIIAHELTHAIVDRLRPHFNVATNPHVRAFHEGFADIVAVFQRLSFRDIVQRALQDSKGNIQQSPVLSDVAAQFGEGLGNGSALRSALRDSNFKLQNVTEEHDRGNVLVAAIYEGFYKTYERRTADLIRIATGGTGELPKGALHPDLVARLTTECVRTAQSVLTMCIRAFDYLPPADVTFGAFLRALVTADWELNPLDEIGIRAAIVEACRLRGIFAVEAGSLAVSALLLDLAREEDWAVHRKTFQRWVDLAIRIRIDEQRAGAKEDVLEEIDERTAQPAQPAEADAYSGAQAAEVEERDDDLRPAKRLEKAIKRWFEGLGPADSARLGMRGGVQPERVHFHSSVRLASDGIQRFGLVVQLVELETMVIAGVERKIPTGATLIIDVTGSMRFVVTPGSVESRKAALEAMAIDALGWPLQTNPFSVDYRGMHEARA